MSYHELEGMTGGLTRELTARAATRGSRMGVNHAETDMREEIAEALRVMEVGETGGKLVPLRRRAGSSTRTAACPAG